jgi:predicted HTH transcriptional regulator
MTTKFKITKSIMALSNIRDGGRIILGIDQCQNGEFDPKGMSLDHFESFTQDDLQDHIGKYIVPYAKARIEKVSNGSLKYIVIHVGEFDRWPVFCGKVYDLTNSLGKNKIIKEGDILTTDLSRQR